jgi:mRNA-degrading endonuclease toxin of MazEF toxin-antitoxin module
MPSFRTTLALGLALFALGIPAAASASMGARAARTPAAILQSTATLRALAACHLTPACQRTAAHSFQAQVRAAISGVLVRDSQYGCDLLRFERAYGTTQNVLTAWAARPNAIRAKLAMGALHSWYVAVDATKTCVR